jgi:hypothetical protein
MPFIHHPKAHLLYLILFLLIGFSSLPSSVKANGTEPASLENLLHGKTVIIEEPVQRLSGIETITTIRATFQPELITYGRILDIQPLIDLRILYFTTISEQSSADAAFRLADENLTRLRNLHREKAVSSRKLLEQSSRWKTVRAQLDAATIRLEGIRESALLKWGHKLTDLLLMNNSPLLKDLIARRQNLLLISLPPGQKLPANTHTILIADTGNRQQAVLASFIDAAPQIDSLSQGKSYFFKTTSPAMKTNMRVIAWVALNEQPISGVFIPEAALIRHLGQYYVYVQLDKESFRRRMISHFITSDHGQFIQHGIRPGEIIVAVGAQMLLSEEFRGQIPDEDDD